MVPDTKTQVQRRHARDHVHRPERTGELRPFAANASRGRVAPSNTVQRQHVAGLRAHGGTGQRRDPRLHVAAGQRVHVTTVGSAGRGRVHLTAR